MAQFDGFYIDSLPVVYVYKTTPSIFVALKDMKKQSRANEFWPCPWSLHYLSLSVSTTGSNNCLLNERNYIIIK